MNNTQKTAYTMEVLKPDSLNEVLVYNSKIEEGDTFRVQAECINETWDICVPNDKNGTNISILKISADKVGNQVGNIIALTPIDNKNQTD